MIYLGCEHSIHLRCGGGDQRNTTARMRDGVSPNRRDLINSCALRWNCHTANLVNAIRPFIYIHTGLNRFIYTTKHNSLQLSPFNPRFHKLLSIDKSGVNREISNTNEIPSVLSNRRQKCKSNCHVVVLVVATVVEFCFWIFQEISQKNMRTRVAKVLFLDIQMLRNEYPMLKFN